MLSQSQARLLKKPALWLAKHSLSLLQARDSKRQKTGPGGRLNKKDGLTRYGDSHANGRLIFNMEIAIRR